MTERRVLAVLVALGAALRLYGLGRESFWGDEIAMALVTGRGWDAMHDELLRGRAPVFLLLGHAWMRAFGTGDAAARALSALAGIASLPMLYVVGRRLVEARAALLGVLLMAVSPFQIAYSQEYRYYSLVVLLTLTTTLLYLRFVESGRGRDALGWSAAAGLLFHTHPYGLLVVVAQDAHFALTARSRPALRRAFVFAHAALAAILLPGLWLRQAGTFTGLQRIPSWIPEPAPWQPVVTLAHFLLPRGMSAGDAALMLALLAVVAVLAARGGGIEVVPPGRDRLALLLLWLTLPLVIPLVASWLYTPVYVDRYVIAASPALYLLAGTALASIREPRTLRLALAAFLLSIAPGLVAYYTTPQKEQWREAAAWVRANARGGDVLVFVEPRERPQSRAFGWYGAGAAAVCSVDRELPDARGLWAAFEACLPASGRAWVFERATATPQQALVDRWTDGPAARLQVDAVERFQGIALRAVRLTRTAPPS